MLTGFKEVFTKHMNSRYRSAALGISGKRPGLLGLGLAGLAASMQLRVVPCKTW